MQPSFEDMLALGNTVFVVLDAGGAGTILYVSPSVVPTLGISVAALLGCAWPPLIHLTSLHAPAAILASCQTACQCRNTVASAYERVRKRVDIGWRPHH